MFGFIKENAIAIASVAAATVVSTGTTWYLGRRTKKLLEKEVVSLMKALDNTEDRAERIVDKLKAAQATTKVKEAELDGALDTIKRVKEENALAANQLAEVREALKERDETIALMRQTNVTIPEVSFVDVRIDTFSAPSEKKDYLIEGGEFFETIISKGRFVDLTDKQAARIRELCIAKLTMINEGTHLTLGQYRAHIADVHAAYERFIGMRNA